MQEKPRDSRDVAPVVQLQAELVKQRAGGEFGCKLTEGQMMPPRREGQKDRVLLHQRKEVHSCGRETQDADESPADEGHEEAVTDRSRTGRDPGHSQREKAPEWPQVLTV